MGQLNLTPMDVNSAIGKAKAWQEALRDMESLADGLLAEAGGECGYEESYETLRRIADLPEPPQQNWFNSRQQAASSALREAVLEFVGCVQRTRALDEQLTAVFEADAIDTLVSTELEDIFEEATDLGFSDSLGDTVKKQLLSVRHRVRGWEKLHSTIKNLLDLLDIEDLSMNGISHSLNAAKIVGETDRSLLLARTETLVSEHNSEILKAAEKRVEDLVRRRDDLGKRYHFTALPEVGKLRLYSSTLRSRKLFSIFDREYREARIRIRYFLELIRVLLRLNWRRNSS